MLPSWKIWMDTGGTFTDCIAIDPHGQFRRLKVLSSGVLRGKIISQPDPQTLQVQLHWPVQKDIFKDFTLTIPGAKPVSRKIKSVDPGRNHILLNRPLSKNFSGHPVEISSREEVPLLAARLLTETTLSQPLPRIEMKLGSTLGTNAILERSGARTALLVTKGFKDLLLIGSQQRPDLFALHIQKERPLYDFVIEVNERTEASGAILKELMQKDIKKIIHALQKKKVESIAISLLNSYKNPLHEVLLAEQLRLSGFNFISSSHELSRQLRILPRAETTVANAYLAPMIGQYLDKIRSGLSGMDLSVMTSAGGLVNANHFYPKDSLLSGPAGGIVGAATRAKLSGVEKLITFDMGGTSTDVSLYDGRYDYRYESKVGEQKILSPSLAIETIAAGGGSICDFDGYRFTVGPESAGASPGPACYGAGGPFTITDVNLLLGRIDPENFAIPLNLNHAKKKLKTLIARVKKASGKKYRPEVVLESLVRIANEKMAEAIKKVSIQRGHNPSDFTLLCFGGAGGQHACPLADLLGINRALVPYDAGLLSAYGIGHAETERFEEELILKPFRKAEGELTSILDDLRKKGEDYLTCEGYLRSEIKLQKELLFLRFNGQESSLEIDLTPVQGRPSLIPSATKAGRDLENITGAFRKKYESVFGHWLASREIEIESAKVIVCVKGRPPSKKEKSAIPYSPLPRKKQKVNPQSGSTSIFRWEDLRAGAEINGPAMIVSNNSTTVVEKGWTFLLDENNNAMVDRKRMMAAKRIVQGEVALLELFTNRFTAIAQEMGALLQRTSFSVNVKERLDFSCALLDAHGYLVVNAPHIPVHLGSLGVCIREVLKVIQLEEGDVVITNHPGYGGSHLPDVTLLAPVFYQGKIVGYVANRAHHAEIGGKKPGSMPSDATMLEEEGVIIAPMYLVKQGMVRWGEISKVFTSARYPTRLLEENLADLNGALAAILFGEQALRELCEKHGIKEIAYYMRSLRSHAERLLRENLMKMPGRSWYALEKLDDGSPLQVMMNVRKGKLRIDFSGSAGVHPGNLNATKAIVQSVVLYVLRILVNQPIPMNEGLMESVEMILPEGLLNPPFSKEGYLPAVVGGNTEVSQRLTDTLLKAFKVAACSQGTMNNVLFGNERFGYYETIAGGTGAVPGHEGSSAVHQHMTNTRITDPELLELRYPVRLEKFEIRKGSGGKGKWRGGDGIVREIFFKEPLEMNILSQHRIEKPYGMNGGSPGKTGEQFIIRSTGEIHHLKGMDSAQVNAGDRLIVKTPGGGGWGKK